MDTTLIVLCIILSGFGGIIIGSFMAEERMKGGEIDGKND